MSTSAIQTQAEALSDVLSPEAVVRTGELLARRTTLRVGGPADIYVEPAREEDLAACLRFCAEQGLAWFVLGRGSNLLVRDRGFRGVMICLCHEAFSRIEARNQSMECGGGARLKQVAIEARRAGLAGLEFLEGIPGSIGGALRMNAGAMGSSLFEIVDRVRLMESSGAIVERSPSQLKVTYRSCASLRDQVALAVVLRGSVDERERIDARMREFSQKRWASQPAAPSAGCMFKNPAGIPAGKLIDELGLKGTRIGAARVSLEHGNFLVNDGGATAADVLGLIELIRERAHRERGVELETEVQIIGE